MTEDKKGQTSTFEHEEHEANRSDNHVQYLRQKIKQSGAIQYWAKQHWGTFSEIYIKQIPYEKKKQASYRKNTRYKHSIIKLADLLMPPCMTFL